MSKIISSTWKQFYTSGLFFDELMHGVVSVPFALITYMVTANPLYAMVTLLTTYIIDSDHWFDYFLYYGLNINLVKFLKMDYFHRSKRAVVIFHAWEWVVIIILLTSGNISIITAIGIGIAGHLVWDTITVKSVKFYFISYRLARGFAFKK